MWFEGSSGFGVVVKLDGAGSDRGGDLVIGIDSRGTWRGGGVRVRLRVVLGLGGS